MEDSDETHRGGRGWRGVGVNKRDGVVDVSFECCQWSAVFRVKRVMFLWKCHYTSDTANVSMVT